MKNQVDSFLERELELSLKDDIFPALTGRLTFVQMMVGPSVVNSQVNVVALDIADHDKMKVILERVKDRVNEFAEEQRQRFGGAGGEQNNDDTIRELEHRGVKYWTVSEFRPRGQFEMDRDRLEGRIEMRVSIPTFAVIDDSLVICDSEDFIKLAIDTSRGDKLALLDNEDFGSVTRRMTNMLGTDMPAGIMYTQPGPNIRWMLDLAKGDGAREWMETDNEFTGPRERRFKQGLLANPLPSYEEIQKYVAPSGGFITADDTGYHILIFNMKAASDD